MHRLHLLIHNYPVFQWLEFLYAAFDAAETINEQSLINFTDQLITVQVFQEISKFIMMWSLLKTMLKSISWLSPIAWFDRFP